MTSIVSQQKRVFNATIQMLLSQKKSIFYQLLSVFPEYTQNLEYFEKKDEPLKLFVSQIIDCKKRGYLNAEKANCQNTHEP